MLTVELPLETTERRSRAVPIENAGDPQRSTSASRRAGRARSRSKATARVRCLSAPGCCRCATRSRSRTC
jgi:hypothetical protein